MFRFLLIAILLSIAIPVSRSFVNKQVEIIAATTLTKYPNFILNGVEPVKYNIKYISKGDYKTTLATIEAQKNLFEQQYKNAKNKDKGAIIKKASNLFTESLVNEIIPFWYGTDWDYNGHTNEPNNGKIACGYFVSTTLKHLGLNINRYKIAQTYSLKAVKVLSDNSVLDFSGKTKKDVLAEFKTLKDGFYVIGLDNHIGYILKRKSEIFFIHSSYLYPGSVCIELAENADALEGHNAYVVAELSSNNNFIIKWLMSTPILVH